MNSRKTHVSDSSMMLVFSSSSIKHNYSSESNKSSLIQKHSIGSRTPILKRQISNFESGALNLSKIKLESEPEDTHTLVEKARSIIDDESNYQRLITHKKESILETVEISYRKLLTIIEETKEAMKKNLVMYFNETSNKHLTNINKLKSIITEMKELSTRSRSGNNSILLKEKSKMKDKLVSKIETFEKSRKDLISDKPRFDWSLVSLIRNFFEFTPGGHRVISGREIDPSNRRNSGDHQLRLSVSSNKSQNQTCLKVNHNQLIEKTAHRNMTYVNLSNDDQDDLTLERLNTGKEITGNVISSIITKNVTPRGTVHQRMFLKPGDDNSCKYLIRAKSSNKEDDHHTLNLSYMKITDQMLERNILPTLNLDSLIRRINIDNNHLTDKGVKLLLKHIKDFGVEELSLGNNSLGEGTIDYLLSFTKYNQKLRLVNLTKVNFESNIDKVNSKISHLKDKGITVNFN